MALAAQQPLEEAETQVIGPSGHKDADERDDGKATRGADDDKLATIAAAIHRMIWFIGKVGFKDGRLTERAKGERPADENRTGNW